MFRSLLVILAMLCARAGAVGLEVRPAPTSGTLITAELTLAGQPLATTRQFGEFSITLENSIHTHRETISHWKPTEIVATADGQTLRLRGQVQSGTLGARIDVEVTYTVINPNTVSKQIALKHAYGPDMFYSLSNPLEPAATPQRYWSFARGDQPAGGAVYEPYPAAGFELENGLRLGLLTDSGARNLWTKCNTTIGMDPSKGLSPITRVPDAELVYLATAAERQQGQDYVGFRFGELHCRDLQQDGKPLVLAYHPLPQGATNNKTLFIFADRCANQREVKIACQQRLAEGLGFEGTDEEKRLFANVQMLTWIQDPVALRAYTVPSTTYQFFYQRDAFWMTAAQLDRKVAEDGWRIIKATQDESGGVSCHEFPYRWETGMPGGQTDANIHWIIWSYLNRVRYGSTLDLPALERNLEWMRRTFANREPGAYWSRLGGWFDVFELAEPVRFSHMQGEYAVALRCAKEIGLQVSDEELNGAMDGYRACYDAKLGYMPFAREAPFDTMLSPTVLMPEFMSLWLFGEPLLTDAQVTSTLDAIDRVWNKRRAEGWAVPNIIRADGEFPSKENKTFAPALWWEPGIYHNGGSWLLYEYLAYTAGHLHGWKPRHVGNSALDRMQRRLTLEFSEHDEPVSHEFLPLTAAIDTPGAVWDGSSDAGVPGPPGSKVFGWNSFVLIANEVAGLRPVRDPVILQHRRAAASATAEPVQ